MTVEIVMADGCSPLQRVSRGSSSSPLSTHTGTISTQWGCELDALSQLLRTAASMETRSPSGLMPVGTGESNII
jgi:hypothetical protein